MGPFEFFFRGTCCISPLLLLHSSPACFFLACALPIVFPPLEPSFNRTFFCLSLNVFYDCTCVPSTCRRIIRHSPLSPSFSIPKSLVSSLSASGDEFWGSHLLSSPLLVRLRLWALGQSNRLFRSFWAKGPPIVHFLYPLGLEIRRPSCPNRSFFPFLIIESTPLFFSSLFNRYL